MKVNRSIVGGVVSIVVCSIALSVFFSGTSGAIPAFARKYETACSTCHVLYPKLNAYGEGFRNNGYRFMGSDEELVKQEDIPMGAEAWKHVFPKGIWPGALPSVPPVAVRGAFGFAYFPDDEDRKSSFQTPWEASLYWGTTLGRRISTYGKVNLDGGGLDRGFVRFDSLFARAINENAFNIRLGKLESANIPFSLTRFVGISVPLAYQQSRNDAGFTIGSRQNGIQLEGILWHHFRYGVGMSNGSGGFRDNDDNKDFFGRLAYKFGGMGFDGYHKALEEGGTLPQTDNWQDNSFTLGLSAYSGKATVVGSDPLENEYTRLGVDFRLQLWNLDLFGVVYDENDDDPFGLGEKTEYTSWFAEADYVILPWMIAALRYDVVEDGTGRGETVDDLERFVPALVFAVRANVKISLEAQLYQGDYEGDVYQALVDLAF